jgi:hypothetical protein
MVVVGESWGDLGKGSSSDEPREGRRRGDRQEWENRCKNRKGVKQKLR